MEWDAPLILFAFVYIYAVILITFERESDLQFGVQAPCSYNAFLELLHCGHCSLQCDLSLEHNVPLSRDIGDRDAKHRQIVFISLIEQSAQNHGCSAH